MIILDVMQIIIYPIRHHVVEIACIDVNTSTTKYRKVEKWKRMSGMYSVIVFNMN
jgi:hypothetical protein